MKWLEFAKGLKAKIGGGNKLADLVGVSRPYLHRILKGRKPISPQMVERLKALRALDSLAR